MKVEIVIEKVVSFAAMFQQEVAEEAEKHLVPNSAASASSCSFRF
jgi:hypothetical protein